MPPIDSVVRTHRSTTGHAWRYGCGLNRQSHGRSRAPRTPATPTRARCRAIGEGDRLAARGRVGAGRRPSRTSCAASRSGRRTRSGPQAFARATRATVLRSGEGLPGRVWETGQATWIIDAATDDRLPRRPAAAAAGLHGASCFPVRSERGLVGVVAVFGRLRLSPTPSWSRRSRPSAPARSGRRAAASGGIPSGQRAALPSDAARRPGLRRDDGSSRARRRVQSGRRAHVRLHAARRRSGARWRS